MYPFPGALRGFASLAAGHDPGPAVQLLDDLELDAAILLAARVRLVVGDRLARAGTARRDALRIDGALVDDPVLHRVSAILRQLLIHGGVALGRGVARDLEADAGVVLQHLHGVLEDALRV